MISEMTGEQLRQRVITSYSIHYTKLYDTFGLLHCSDPTCVMLASTYVEEIDPKGAGFCGACLRTLRGDCGLAADNDQGPGRIRLIRRIDDQDVALGERIRQRVITSYSIHYTKLYEVACQTRQKLITYCIY